MKKKIVTLLLTTAMLSSLAVCGNGAVVKGAESTEGLSSGTPWIDSDLIGAITEDMEFDLKDDFAAAVNKDWHLQAELAPGYSQASSMADVSIQTDEQLAELITGENEQNDETLAQIQSLYEMYTDWDARNEAGMSPLMPVLEKLESIQCVTDMNDFLSLDAADRALLDGPFGFQIMQDFNDSSRYTILVMPSDLILGDSAEYEKLTELGALIKENKLELLRKLLQKIGYSVERTEEIISNAMEYETAIAPSIPTSDEQNSSDFIEKINNPVTREELEEMQGDLPIVSTFIGDGVQDADFTDAIVPFLDWIEAVKGLYTDENIPKMRDDMIAWYVLSAAKCLDEECYQWVEETNNTISGVQESASVEQKAVGFVQSALKWQLTKVYCNRYFTQEDKDRIYELSMDIIAEYREMLLEEDFLSEETIAYACEKLDNMNVFSLYPDDEQWPDYSEFSFKSAEEGGSFWDACSAIEEYNLRTECEKLGEQSDRSCWNNEIVPTKINCVNIPLQNAIYIYAAFCQGELYNSDMTTEELYATMGAVIGHEISHSFDSSGSQYDKKGNLANWWTQEDYQVFSDKNQKMIDYYNTICPWEGQQVHGEIITGEACADMAGLKVMLRLAESEADFDYDKFFRTYASLWRQRASKEHELYGLTDVHPLNYLRINANLAQFDKFQEVYGIEEGDGMYIAPEDRVNIW